MRLVIVKQDFAKPYRDKDGVKRMCTRTEVAAGSEQAIFALAKTLGFEKATLSVSGGYMEHRWKSGDRIWYEIETELPPAPHPHLAEMERREYERVLQATLNGNADYIAAGQYTSKQAELDAEDHKWMYGN
jgi:hypothetical protein